MLAANSSLPSSPPNQALRRSSSFLSLVVMALCPLHCGGLVAQPLDNREHMIGPNRQCGLDLVFIAMAIVDRFNTPFDMVEHALGDMRSDAELTQAGSA